MSILIFGGTTEGRLLARELSRRGLPAWVSVATPCLLYTSPSPRD